MGFFTGENETENNNSINETNVDDASNQSGTEDVFNDENDIDGEISSDTDTEPEQEYDFIISVESFERFASVIGFLFGLMINWGSLNIVGFMIGLNYRYLLSSGSYNKIICEVQTIIPAFMLGVLIVHLSLIYFTVSVFVGYAVKSKNINVLNENFLKKNSIEVNIRNYSGVFYELLGIYGNEKKES
tara:strand:- start:99 stop:659 length:561 start_codon:yes stop_codon:yes gene_type:complete